MKPGFAIGGALALFVVLTLAMSARAATIITFDPPDATSTEVWGINDRGVVVGSYLDSRKRFHGFLRMPDGTLTAVDEPNAGKRKFDGTNATGINKSGTVIGYFLNSSGYHGFLSTLGVGFTEFDVEQLGTFPKSINDEGTIAGEYVGFDGVSHGFVRAVDGKITVFDPAGAEDTNVASIGSTGAIAGWYLDVNLVPHGFLRRDNTFVTFDGPGATETYLSGINADEFVVGYYSDGNREHGFRSDPSGAIVLVDVPGSLFTFASAINRKGGIAGRFRDERNLRGYLHEPIGGFVDFEVSGAKYTIPTSLNARGDIAGTYSNNSKSSHGFVRMH